MWKLACLLALAVSVFADGGKTGSNSNAAQQECASSSPVVESTVSQIEAECIFPDNKQFMRRLAFVESRDGIDPNPCEDDSYHGGIWRIDEDRYDATKAQSGGQYLSSIVTSINSQLGIDWAQTTWRDLRKPLYSALGAMLYYTLESKGAAPPRDLNGQGQFWVDHFEGENVQQFVDLSLQLEKNCTTSKTDITFILDASGSVGDINFEKAKDFVIDVIKGFNVGPDATQFSVINYASNVKVEFYLNDYHDKDELIDRVGKIKFINGGTNTGEALRIMRTDVFSESRGARSSQDVPSVGIVVTDGKSQSFPTTVSEADECKAAKINMMSAGVGSNVNDNELNAMASPPVCTNIFHISNYEEMQHLPKTVQEKSCSAPRTMSPGQPTNVTIVPGEIVNCVVDVTSKGQSIKVSASSGSLDYYVSYLTYPSQVFFDNRVTAIPGSPGYMLINNTQGDGEQQVVFCGIGSENKECSDGSRKCEGTIEPNAEPGPSPCTQAKCPNGACVEEGDTYRCGSPFRYEEFTVEETSKNYVLVMTRRVNLPDANKYCSDHHNGSLASVPDVETREALSGYLKKMQDKYPDYRFNEIGTAEKTNNKENDPVNEPDDLNSEGQHCAVLQAWDPVNKNFLGDTYTLQSKPCDRPRTFLCEEAAPPVTATRCKDYNKPGKTATGVYNILLKEDNKVIRVSCQIGWTVIQRREGDTVDFANRRFAEYENGFGDPEGDYWAGLKLVAQLGKTNLKVEFEDQANGRGSQYYQNFHVGGGPGYILLNSQYGGGSERDAFWRAQFEKVGFSAFDYDQDKNPEWNCALRTTRGHKGGWWHPKWCANKGNMNANHPYWTGNNIRKSTVLMY